MFDRNMNYIIASKRFLIDYDIKEQNVIGRSHYEIFPEITEGWKEIHKRCLAGEILKSENDLFPRACGILDWVRWEIHPWYNEQNEIGGIILFSEVITKRKQTEEALEKSQKLLKEITDNSTMHIYALDLEGKFLLINHSLEAVFGVPRETLLGKTREAILPAAIASEHRANDLIVMNNRQSITLEEENIETDGKHTYISVKFPLLDSQGHLVGIGGVSTDITKRKQAEEALKENERLLRESQVIARLGSFVWDLSTGLWKSSEILDEIFGINENYIRSLEGWANIVHPGWQKTMTDYVSDEVLGKLQKFDKEYQIIRQNDGTERWVH